MVQNGRWREDSNVRGFRVPSARRGNAGRDVDCTVYKYRLGEAFRISERAGVRVGERVLMNGCIELLRTFLVEPARETAIGWSRTVGGEKTRIYEDSVSRPLDVATPAATSTVRCTSTVSVRRSGSERGRPCSVGIQ